nr:hypothetical protein CFP56_10434 [Quercus suber]
MYRSHSRSSHSLFTPFRPPAQGDQSLRRGARCRGCEAERERRWLGPGISQLRELVVEDMVAKPEQDVRLIPVFEIRIWQVIGASGGWSV